MDQPSSMRFLDGPVLVVQDAPDHGATCIIVDYTWWVENQYDLEDDIAKHGITRLGMVLFFPDAEARLLWKLRWS
jgi:hypothetical protein